MATLTITNSGSTNVYCSDLFCQIVAGGTVTTTRAASDLSRMASLQGLIAAGSVAVSVAYTANETASGLVNVGASASPAAGLGSDDIIRVAIAASTGGTADDITVYALGSLPYKKLRVVAVDGFVSTSASTSTMQVRTATGGSGTLLGEVSSATTGHVNQTATVTATSAITSSGTVGLFVHRSNNTVAGELLIRVRPEL